MAADAVRLAEAVSYCGAGTVEFMYDLDRHSYHFLEMNTRIQVEHPVTEELTGVDLVKEQIRVCSGLGPSFDPRSLQRTGHAIECRINAEDPFDEFRPSPGTLYEWRTPAASGLRIDTHCYAGYRVPPYYDSLLAKVVVRADSREEAIDRMEEALNRIVVRGVATTLPFQRAVMRDDEYRSGDITTDWVERTFMQRWCNHQTNKRRRDSL